MQSCLDGHIRQSFIFEALVTFTDAEMVYHLSGTLDCARRENDRIILQNNALEKEVKELRTVHINQDKLKEKVAFLENRVNLYKQLEINLKEIVTGIEIKVKGYYNSILKAKEIFNQQAISQTVVLVMTITRLLES